MEAVLLRTGSVPVRSEVPAGSPRPSLSRHESIGGAFCGGSLNLRTNRRDHGPSRISRALSESHVFSSVNEIGSGSRSVSAGIPEEYVVDGRDSASFPSIWPGYGIPTEELGISGGGFGGGEGSGGGGDESKIGDYYREMVKQNPGDPLLLRNYAKFLDEVERDRVKAEEYYGRAILASPGDGEVLSLYGKLIWETQSDKMRAKWYFDRAVHASPGDCMVVGSYAQFMWEAEEEEEEEEDEEVGEMKLASSSTAAAMVELVF